MKPAPLFDFAAGDAAPAIILCSGRGESRPHASWFNAADSERAVAAAGQMGMHAIAIAGDDLRRIATQLPKGKIFSSGKAFVPFVRASLFEEIARRIPNDNTPPVQRLRLVAEGDGGKPDKDAPRPKTPAPISTDRPNLPEDWSKITVGSIVLAREAIDEGWFEAIVTKEGENGAVWLKWQGWPELETFVRYRPQLALLYPGNPAATAN